MDIRKTPLYAESWNVAYRLTPRLSILTNKQAPPFTIIPNNLRYWAADPMVFEHNGIVCIFAELYDYVKRRGVIGVSVYNGKKFGKWRAIIAEDTHLSYPFVFRHGQKIYMIPESCASEKLVLYEAVKFPYEWKKVKTILDKIRLVDTTLVKTDRGFFGYTQQSGKESKDLQILLDNELNVVELSECKIQQPNKYRNGGYIFDLDEKYVRVCQDCVSDYGVALYFRTVNKETLCEEKSERLAPEDLLYDKYVYLDGMHNYSAIDSMEVIDIKTRRLNLINLLFRTINKFTVKR